MGRIKSYIAVLQEMSQTWHFEWQIAIRKKGGAQTLYSGNRKGFVPVPNTFRYWYADPFLFTHEGKDYLFAEMYDRWKGKGVLGVCRIRNGKCGRFKMCLELPGHLSYPCVFEDETGIHMLPECYQSGEIALYRCVKFPYRWEKEAVLLHEIGVDTTPCMDHGQRRWLTTLFPSVTDRRNCNLWQLDATGAKKICLFKENYTVCGAGHLIAEGDTWIRPSQNCTDSYGQNLIFNRGRFDNGIYCESPFCVVYPPTAEDQENRLELQPGTMKKAYDGIHTYNENERYEVVDLRYSGAKSVITLWKNLCSHMAAKRKRG